MLFRSKYTPQLCRFLLQRQDEVVANPDPTGALRTGDVLIVLGRPVDLSALDHYLRADIP